MQARGWRESRAFTMPPPIGRARGYLVESVHAATLPRIFPTIRDADFWVDSRVPGLNSVLSLVASVPALQAHLGSVIQRSSFLARAFGSVAGGMLVEIEDAPGGLIEARIFARRRSHLRAVAPAVLATCAIASDRFTTRGLVPHDLHVEPEEMFAYLRRLEIDVNFSSKRPEKPAPH